MGLLQYEAGGRTYRLTSMRGSSLYKIGDIEQVRDLPENPAVACEDHFRGFDLLFVVLGCGTLALGLASAWMAQAVKRAQNR